MSIAGDKDSPLTVQNLTVSYQRNPAIDDVSFTLPPATLAALVGPNGAGKSTVLKACLGLLPVNSGKVFVYGKPYQQNRKRVGYVPQRESVDWDFPVSVLDVVAMGTYHRLGWFRPVNRSVKEQARQALDRVGLADLANRQISQLSGGQQQRVFLARALVQNADVYLMDEPFAAVDAATEQAIVSLLKQFQKEGKSCLVVHHDLPTVTSYFDWTILLHQTVIASGPTKEAFTSENLQRTYGGKLNVQLT